MTDSPAPLAYATPTAEQKSPYRMLIAALAVAAGFLKANSFADAVGIPSVNDVNHDPGYLFLRIVCGGVVAFLTIAILLVLVREGRALVNLLARTQDRPGMAIALTCIITGAVCLLGALAIPLYFAHGTSVRISNGSAVTGIETPMLTQLLAVLTFVVGGFLIGIGVWSGTGRRGSPVYPSMPRDAAPGGVTEGPRGPPLILNSFSFVRFAIGAGRGVAEPKAAASSPPEKHRTHCPVGAVPTGFFCAPAQVPLPPICSRSCSTSSSPCVSRGRPTARRGAASLRSPSTGD